MKSSFIKEENSRERKEDMLGEESSKGKADDLAYYTSRKGSPLKTIISIDASHKIFGGKPL